MNLLEYICEMNEKTDLNLQKRDLFDVRLTKPVFNVYILMNRYSEEKNNKKVKLPDEIKIVKLKDGEYVKFIFRTSIDVKSLTDCIINLALVDMIEMEELDENIVLTIKL